MTDATNYKLEAASGIAAMPELLEAFRSAFVAAKVPAANGQAAYNHIAQWFDGRARELDRSHRQAVRQAVQEAFGDGPQLQRTLQLAKQGAAAIGLDNFNFSLQPLETVALIQRLRQHGERLAAPASTPPHTPSSPRGNEQMGSSRSEDQIQDELNLLHSDPEMLAIIANPRHLRHERVMEKRRGLIAELNKVRGGDRIDPNEGQRGRAQSNLEQLRHDSEFIQRTSDVRNPGYRDAMDRRQRMIAEASGSSSPASSIGASGQSTRREELAALHRDSAFMAKLNDTRHHEHHAAVEQRQQLIRSIATEEAGAHP
jgi:hypothetical protein